MAQYLKKQSVTPISLNTEESSEELSLKKILDDKPRKICARMFYETLVRVEFMQHMLYFQLRILRSVDKKCAGFEELWTCRCLSRETIR